MLTGFYCENDNERFGFIKYRQFLDQLIDSQHHLKKGSSPWSYCFDRYSQTDRLTD